MDFYINIISARMYGLMLLLAVIAAYIWAKKILVPHKNELKNLPLLLDKGVLWGVVGARLYHVIDKGDYYILNPVKIFFLWEGGLSIFGVLLGILLMLIVEVRNKIWWWLDLIARVLPLAQAIGRWGNYFNQELYGPRTNLPWGIFIKQENDYFHPLFAYEAILNFGLWLIMEKSAKSKNYELGSRKYLGIYLIGYGMIRFLLEFLRMEGFEIWGVRVAQILTLFMIVVGGLCLRSQKIKS